MLQVRRFEKEIVAGWARCSHLFAGSSGLSSGFFVLLCNWICVSFVCPDWSWGRSISLCFGNLPRAEYQSGFSQKTEPTLGRVMEWNYYHDLVTKILEELKKQEEGKKTQIVTARTYFYLLEQWAKGRRHCFQNPGVVAPSWVCIHPGVCVTGTGTTQLLLDTQPKAKKDEVQNTLVSSSNHVSISCQGLPLMKPSESRGAGAPGTCIF